MSTERVRIRPREVSRFLALALSILAGSNVAIAQSHPATQSPASTATLGDFQVFEFRRYTVRPGEREHFAQYFESYFPEAFQQLGALAFGSFFEREHNLGFTWIRGFHTIEARAVVNAEFYYGPVWKEHKKTLNDLMTDSDNVLLLHPLSPDRSLPVLPSVDPVTEPNGAQGVLVAQIFAVKKDEVEAFARQAEPAFAAYRAAGVREAGVLATLDVPNNFPQLPVRTDGPYLVWLGILKDDQSLETQFNPTIQKLLPSLQASGMLRNTPELVVLHPTRRSRLRWLNDKK